MKRNKYSAALMTIVLLCNVIGHNVFVSGAEQPDVDNISVSDNTSENPSDQEIISGDDAQTGEVEALPDNMSAVDSNNGQDEQKQADDKKDITEEQTTEVVDAEIIEEVLEGDIPEEEDVDEEIINVALPTEFHLVVDAYGLEHETSNQQIFSDTYEVVNYGTEDVLVTMQPSMEAEDCEWIDTPPNKHTDIEANDPDKQKAVFLAMRVADRISNITSLSDYTFTNEEYDQVLSSTSPDTFSFFLKGTDEEGNVSPEGRSAFQFVGNVDPDGKYVNSEIKVEVVFSIHKIDATWKPDGKIIEKKENLVLDY